MSGQRLAVPPREAQPGPDRLPPDVEQDYLQVNATCSYTKASIPKFA